MKYSIITDALLFKVDTKDNFGFALNHAINSFIIKDRKYEVRL